MKDVGVSETPLRSAESTSEMAFGGVRDLGPLAGQRRVLGIQLRHYLPGEEPYDDSPPLPVDAGVGGGPQRTAAAGAVAGGRGSVRYRCTS